MSKKHKQFYRDTVDEPDSELEEEEDDSSDEEVGLEDTVQQELKPSPSTSDSGEEEEQTPSLSSNPGLEAYLRILSDPNRHQLQPFRVRQIPHSSTQTPPLPMTTVSPPRTPVEERSTSGSPAPDNVIRYLNPLTGFPYLGSMREDIENAGTSDNIPLGRKLAQKGRAYRREAYTHLRGKKGRKQQLLSSLEGFRYDSEKDRYLPRHDLPPPEDPNPEFKWQPLSPSSSSAPDRNEFDRKRFNRSVRDMKREHWPSDIMPRGRVGYGDISPYDMAEMRRSLREDNPESFKIKGIRRHEDPSHWTPRELAFSHRLRNLSPSDLKRYIELQSEYNPDLSCNQAATNRMTPRPTQYNMYHLGDKRVQEIRSSTEGLHKKSRAERRQNVSTRSILPSSFDTEAPPLQLTPITRAKKGPYTFTTYPADPVTHLIPTTRSRQKKKAEEARKKIVERIKKKKVQEAKKKIAEKVEQARKKKAEQASLEEYEEEPEEDDK